MATFIERLKELQEEHKALKKDIAAHLGVSIMGFYRWRIVKSSATFSYRKLHREYDNRGIYEDAC